MSQKSPNFGDEMNPKLGSYTLTTILPIKVSEPEVHFVPKEQGHEEFPKERGHGGKGMGGVAPRGEGKISTLNRNP